MQRCHIASVYIIYIRHTLIARAGAVASLRFNSVVLIATCMYCVSKCRVEKEVIYTGKRDTASEESKAKGRESDRLAKKRCIQGEISGDK